MRWFDSFKGTDSIKRSPGGCRRELVTSRVGKVKRFFIKTHAAAMWWKQTLWVEATTDCSLETIKMWVWCCERWAEHTVTNKTSRKQHIFVSSVINLEAFLSLPVAHMLAATLGKWQTAFFFSGKMIKFDHISCFNQIDSINQITWLFITPFFFPSTWTFHHLCCVVAWSAWIYRAMWWKKTSASLVSVLLRSVASLPTFLSPLLKWNSRQNAT